MRPVNLLPSRYRPARASGDRPGIAYFAIGALAVLLLMVLLLVVTQNGIDDANQKTAEAQAEQQVAQARVGQLQAYGDFASLKTSREAAVAGVAELRFDYERLMREIALVLPHDTYLTNLAAAPGGGAEATAVTATASATGPTVAVTGCAPSHKGVATAIVRLRSLHNVESVDLTSSTKAATSTTTSAGNVCEVTWVAALAFKAETPTPSPVPVRLGGGQ